MHMLKAGTGTIQKTTQYKVHVYHLFAVALNDIVH